MFDEKVLIVIIGLLIALGMLKQLKPEVSQTTDFFIFGIGSFSAMVLMHYFGYLEGLRKGFNEAKKNNQKPFFPILGLGVDEDG